jgi:Leucine-rich repeat (LRR) protein
MALHDLEELDLGDNSLTKLPKDLSRLAKLKSIDLTNNPLKNVR